MRLRAQLNVSETTSSQRNVVRLLSIDDHLILHGLVLEVVQIALVLYLRAVFVEAGLHLRATVT